MLASERANAMAVAIGPYLEKKFPFVGLTPNPSDHSTDNGILFSATYAVLAWGAVTSYSRAWVAVRERFICLEENLRVRPGLYNRYPGDSSSLNSHDNLIGLMAGLFFYAPIRTRDVLCWGADHRGSWNNQAPYTWTLRSFLARVPGVWAFVKSAAGWKLNLFDQIVWSAACLWSCLSKREDTSGKCLQYLQIQVLMGKRYRLCDWAIRIWREQMQIMYPSGMKEVYAIYFGPEHPFAVYGPEDF